MMFSQIAVFRRYVALSLVVIAHGATAQIAVPVESGSRLRASTAQQRLTPACSAAKQYVNLGRDHKVADIGPLFAPEVDYIGPDAKARRTGKEVADVYAAMSKTDWARLSEVHLYRLVPLNRNECFMEFSSGPPGGPILYGVDHFIVNAAGKIIWFRLFFEQAFRF